MPVIVVGADTPVGREVIDVFDRAREVRAFVTDEREASRLRKSGVKVALGDVSDDSHVEAASMGCFSAVLIAAAASDDRQRSFASSPREVLAGWARAITAAGVTRAIWVGVEEPPGSDVPEVALVPVDRDVARRVADADDAQRM